MPAESPVTGMGIGHDPSGGTDGSQYQLLVFFAVSLVACPGNTVGALMGEIVYWVASKR